jgi:hypothetical protein
MNQKVRRLIEIAESTKERVIVSIVRHKGRLVCEISFYRKDAQGHWVPSRRVVRLSNLSILPVIEAVTRASRVLMREPALYPEERRSWVALQKSVTCRNRDVVREATRFTEANEKQLPQGRNDK